MLCMGCEKQKKRLRVRISYWWSEGCLTQLSDSWRHVCPGARLTLLMMCTRCYSRRSTHLKCCWWSPYVQKVIQVFENKHSEPTAAVAKAQGTSSARLHAQYEARVGRARAWCYLSLFLPCLLLCWGLRISCHGGWAIFDQIQKS